MRNSWDKKMNKEKGGYSPPPVNRVKKPKPTPAPTRKRQVGIFLEMQMKVPITENTVKDYKCTTK